MAPLPTLREIDVQGRPAPRRAVPKALTVAQVVARIRSLIEERFPSPLWVEGELSNVSCPASGHIYFDLADEQVSDRRGQRLLIPCAFFRNANQHVKFTLEDGLKVLCYGEVTTYEARGQYQLRVLAVEPKGVGALQLAFEQLKKRLQAEGLFEDARKRPIPEFPDRVGVITSRTGAVIHDILDQLDGWIDVVLVPAKVQGDGAAAELVEAIELANGQRIADVLIVGRGGGSVEDLWAFNDEQVARAIARSRIPVISAVGHQDDWTIADYVADLRASTPTDAARRLAEARQTLAEQGRAVIEQLVDAMRAWLEDAEQAVTQLGEQLRLLHPRHQLTAYEQRAHRLLTHLVQGVRHTLLQQDRKLEGLAGRLQALSPLAVLARGYSITFKLPDRSIVTHAKHIKPGDHLETALARGRLTSTVTHVKQES